MNIIESIYFTCSMFFFFKQKTAYELRISDWSSDVCSSDLECPVARVVRRQVEGDLASRKHVHGVLHRVMARMTVHHLEEMAVEVDRVLHHRVVDQRYPHALVASEADRLDDLAEPATVERPDRKSVV